MYIIFTASRPLVKSAYENKSYFSTKRYVVGTQKNRLNETVLLNTKAYFRTDEACIGVLGIQDICHFTFRDIGYYPFYFQGYGILGSIFSLLQGILKS